MPLDVCSIRLDFDSFVLADPNDQTAAGNDGGQCLTDSLSFATSAGNKYPTICGVNTGYHGTNWFTQKQRKYKN